MRAILRARRANARAADEVTPSAHAASQVRTHERDRICRTAPHRNTFEIMRLFATYQSAHARFTLRDATASTMTAWKSENIQSHAAAQITSDRACWGRTGDLPVGGLRPRVHRAALRSHCEPDRRIRSSVLSSPASAQARGRSAEPEAGQPRAGNRMWHRSRLSLLARGGRAAAKSTASISRPACCAGREHCAGASNGRTSS